MKFNPFAFLVETKRFTYARILRSSFTKKITDAFSVIYGSSFAVLRDYLPWIPEVDGRDRTFDNARTHRRAGLFDWATGFLFLVIDKGFHWLANKWIQQDTHIPWKYRTLPQKIKVGIFFGLGVINSLLNFVRFIASVALTCVGLPFLAIAHQITTSKAKKSIESAMAMPGNEQVKNDDGGLQPAIPTSLGKFLNKNKLSTENIQIKPFAQNNLFTFDNCRNEKSTFQFFAEKQQPEISALLELNVGGITSWLEKDEPEYLNTLLSPV